jgi:hypothetical protein
MYTVRKGKEVPSKIQICLFAIYFIILMVLIFNLFGLVNFYAHANNGNTQSNSTVVPYTIDWQNQPGIPFSIANGSTYQFFDIHLVIISDSNFAQNTNITIYAYGTMSASFSNSSLEGIQISYDGAIPYPQSGGYSAGPYLDLTVNPNGHGGIVINKTVYIISKPISVTWAFASGPHYPTITIQYWDEGTLSQQFSSAPIMIQSSQPNQTIQENKDTTEQIATNWVIGSAFIAIVEAVYLRYPKKKRIEVPLK